MPRGPVNMVLDRGMGVARFTAKSTYLTRENKDRVLQNNAFCRSPSGGGGQQDGSQPLEFDPVHG